MSAGPADWPALPAALDEARLAVLGLGLMGGSLALGLRGRCRSLVGSDPDPQVCRLAVERGIVDEAATDPAHILAGADVVILAAPVRAILTLLGRLPDLHPGRALVLDIGSTKAEICAAMHALPPRFDPLGGHPMCGKERSGLEQAEAGLYQGAPFALTPLARTSPQAVTLAEALVAALGAHALRLDAAVHDAWAASVSHAPYLLACALALGTPAEAAALIGPGWRGMGRLAGSSTVMMEDILLTNRAETLAALARLRVQCDALSAALDDHPQTLRGLLEQAAARRRSLLGEG